MSCSFFFRGSLQLFLLACITYAQPSAADSLEPEYLDRLPVLAFGDGGLNRSGDYEPVEARMKSWGVPGLSLAGIEEGRLAWTAAYGTVSAEGGGPVTDGSMFQAASVSKLVTAAIVLHYVGENRFDLDRDVNEYLTRWKVAENEFTRQAPVTLRTLLAHQAGMPMTNFDVEEGSRPPTLVQLLKAEPPALNRPATVESAPGGKWNYSNIGYDVVQLVLEDALDTPFVEIAHEVVFDPLRMESSTFQYPLPESWAGHEAMPHDREGAQAEPQMTPVAVAHGGMMTTASDLAEFALELMRAYRGVSDRLLTPELAQELLSNQVGLNPAMFGMPESMNMAQALGPILRWTDSGFCFMHTGHNQPGSVAWLEVCPESGQGMAILANGAGGELLALEILTAAIDAGAWPAGPYVPR